MPENNLSQKPPGRVTAVYIDGNSISVGVVSKQNGNLVVEDARHLEMDGLIEVVERVRHPIFMDVDRSDFPGAALCRECLAEIFKDPLYQNPVLTVIPPDRMKVLELKGPNRTEEMLKRRGDLLRRINSANPFYYPSLMKIKEVYLGDGMAATRLLVGRLQDMLETARVVEHLGPHFIGVLSGLTSQAAIARRLPVNDLKPCTTLCDIGKLRTIYTIRKDSGLLVQNRIPVGLARDDMHYFKGFSPVINKLCQLKLSLGSLLLPMEATPSPVFDTRTFSPQVDLTRFAIHVSRYAVRAMSADTCNPEPLSNSLILAGRPARLPGLRQFIEARAGVLPSLLDEIGLDGVQCAGDLYWNDVTDTLSALGGVFHLFDPHPSDFGLLVEDRPFITLTGKCSFGELKEDELYVLERPGGLELR